MLTDDEAYKFLRKLIINHCVDSAEAEDLIRIVDEARGFLPVRGVLESLGKYKEKKYSKEELELIDDLLYMYG